MRRTAPTLLATAFSLLALLSSLSAAAQKPVSSDSLSLLVRSRIYEGLYYDALDLLDELPDSLMTPTLTRQKASILSSFAQYPEAKATIQPLVRSDSLIIDLQQLAGIYESMGQRDSATVVRETIYYRSPYNIVNLLHLTQLYEADGLAFLGQKKMDLFLEKYPSNRPIRQRRAGVNYGLGFYDDAYADFDTLFWAGDRSMNTLYYHGQSLRRKDSLDAAIPVLKEAIRVIDGNPYPMIDLASIYLEKKQVTEGRKYLAMADSVMSDTPAVHSLMAYYYDSLAEADFLRGAYRSSISDLDRMVQHVHIVPDVPYRKSLAYRKLGDDAKEMEQLRAYLDMREPHDGTNDDSPRLRYARKRLKQLEEDTFMQR